MSLTAIPEGPLRNGYTTGACATACTKAALLTLINQKIIKAVTIKLPAGIMAEFKIASCYFTGEEAQCSTIKDAGDDPDVTHGAEIGCNITFNNTGEVIFLRGEGVGLVTLSGLAIPVGEPAINPVPRQMMKTVVAEILQQSGIKKGINIKVYVTNGEALAKRTLNARIGILGGISILGTTGIVRPFSASAYIASITQGIDVAISNGSNELVINSGGRTENMLRQMFIHLPEFAFIQYGNWIGETLQKIQTTAIEKVTMGIMLGKAAKLAQGILNTHSSKSEWNRQFIYQLAIECGYSVNQCEPILEITMARNLTDIFPFNEQELLYKRLCACCYNTCKPQIGQALLDIILIDNNNSFIHYKQNSNIIN